MGGGGGVRWACFLCSQKKIGRRARAVQIFPHTSGSNCYLASHPPLFPCPLCGHPVWQDSGRHDDKHSNYNDDVRDDDSVTQLKKELKELEKEETDLQRCGVIPLGLVFPLVSHSPRGLDATSWQASEQRKRASESR